MSLKEALAAKKTRTTVQKEEPMKRLNVNITESKIKGKAATEGLEMSTFIHL